ncbi:hypothetical protein ACOJUR_06640 [Alicyclobacillus tolerans]|uniref:hypothetical protein n=1 Tax=Alicyclobacillus tolerans TaxID=90970 RepID=UPI003B811B01
MKIIIWKKIFHFNELGFQKLMEKGWVIKETLSYIRLLSEEDRINPIYIVQRIFYSPHEELEFGMIPMGEYRFIRTFFDTKDLDIWKKLMTHPVLIELLETYGDQITHPMSTMKIIEVPNDIDWEIVPLQDQEIAIVDKQRIWSA